MDYTYYPGCSLTKSTNPYDLSTRAVFEALGLGLHELEDWNCCGATVYMSVKETVSFAISARNLALAEKIGRDVVAPCSACYLVLNKTNRFLHELPELNEKVNEALSAANLHYGGTVRVRHPLEVLVHDLGIEEIARRARVSLQGLRVAEYYGCQIVRPERMPGEDQEFPQSMDRLFAALGAENVYFPMKVRCCGGMLMTTRDEIAIKLCRELIECAKDNGADCLVTTCPLCQMNLAAYQDRLSAGYKDMHMPVLWFTELLGLALGVGAERLGLDRHLEDVTPVTDKVMALSESGR